MLLLLILRVQMEISTPSSITEILLQYFLEFEFNFLNRRRASVLYSWKKINSKMVSLLDTLNPNDISKVVAVKYFELIMQTSALIYVCYRLKLYRGKRSLDRISLDRITWSKVSNNLGVWSKLCFFTWSNYLRLFSWSKVLLMSFWVILNFRSTAKIHRFFFGSWSNVLLAKK